MQAFFTDDQLLHDPQQFMRLGRIAKPTDLPSRAHALRDALGARGITLEAPADCGRAPLEATKHNGKILVLTRIQKEQARGLDLAGDEVACLLVFAHQLDFYGIPTLKNVQKDAF